MPSTSKKQHNFMAAVANNPDFAQKTGVPMSVGEDYMAADKRKTFRVGGAKTSKKQGINKQQTNRGERQLPNVNLNKYIGRREGGIMKAVDAKKNPGLSKLPTEVRNKMGYMNKGGMAMTAKEDMKMDKKVVKKAVGMHDKQMHGGKKTDLETLKKGGMAVKKMAMGGMTSAPKKMAKGGGCEVRGKTKGTMIKMKKGGSC